ncbi:hypothetical protein [Azospirillum sp. TSA6c]|uniref:hypothetical protein n=1 Tax=Azospirillum sp. TSA6c TaxID=709813 RepID=UPI0011B446EB|nr:hypothetical protein [Azospirillum sp. TSA6c]
MGCEFNRQQRHDLLRSMVDAHTNGLLTGPGDGLEEKLLRPAPVPEVREWVTEEPTGLLNQYGRPIFRVRRIMSGEG